jgi:hypothetical protein
MPVAKFNPYILSATSNMFVVFYSILDSYRYSTDHQNIRKTVLKVVMNIYYPLHGRFRFAIWMDTYFS